MFACCDEFGKGDKQLSYDCKTNLPGGGTCNDEDDCKANYKNGLAVIEAEKLKGDTDDDEDQLMQWVIVLSVVILGGSILIGMFIVFWRTNCCG